MTSVVHLEVLVEEPSMEAALRDLLPRMLGEVSFQIHPFQCKEDMLGKLPARLRGYSRWLPENYRILVLLDRDDDDCRALRRRMDEIASAAGLRTHRRDGGSWQVVNRLAIEELEAWFFGDWEAVMSAYPRVADNIPHQAGYRDPDAITGGTWEALERVLQRVGYFKTGLRKIEAARSIAEHLVPERNRSRSFHVFRVTMEEVAGAG